MFVNIHDRPYCVADKKKKSPLRSKTNQKALRRQSHKQNLRNNNFKN